MQRVEHFDVVVVGAGLVGAAVAHDLSAAGARTLVLEAGPEPAYGVSRSNSGILHTGFDSTPGTLETEMILAHGTRWRSLFAALEVPYRVPGALLVATDDEQLERLPGLAENAAKNGIETRLLDETQSRAAEPGTEATGALLVPGEAITDPFEVVRRLLATGPETRLNWSVGKIEDEGDIALVHGEAGTVSARFVINCAGLHGDDVAGDGSFGISARRGEFAVFPPGSADLVRHILLPVPSSRTKGVLVFPTIHGRLCAGPSAVDQDDKEDWRPRRSHLREVLDKAEELFPPIRQMQCTESWAGLRPVGHPHDYIVQWSERTKPLLHVAAIRSTGLSAFLGISQHVLAMLIERGLEPSPTTACAAPVFDGPLVPWWERLNAVRNISGPC